MTWRQAMTDLEGRGFRPGLASMLLREAWDEGSTEFDGVEIVMVGINYEIKTVKGS